MAEEFDLPEGVEPKQCAVCGLPLEAYRPTGSDEVHYLHARRSDQDHVPVPVGLDELEGVSRCDFCDQPDTFIVLAESFVMPFMGQIGGDVVQQNSVGNWAACDECMRFVERHDWGRLTTRVKTHAPPSQRRVPRRIYLQMYEELGKHITGIITKGEWIARRRPQ